MTTPRPGDQLRRRISQLSRAEVTATVLLVGVLGVLLADLVSGMIHGHLTGWLSTGWRWGLELAFVVLLSVAGARATLIDPLTGQHPSGFARECLVGVANGTVGLSSVIGIGMSVLGAFSLGLGDAAFKAVFGAPAGWMLGLGIPMVGTGTVVLPIFWGAAANNPRFGRPFGRTAPRQVFIVAVAILLAFLGLGLLLRLVLQRR
ncbi:hypothetical protein [Pseudonocardia spinosispora]|uniref:hypothetical protein n=1 Tax=Pseudonocardia spinosispora TaxID=103441 RepID=UPI00040ED847|nr:hypothetical protein [Pseudonocardia spinosispora]